MKTNTSLFPSLLILLGAITPLPAQEDHHRQDPGQPAQERQQPGSENPHQRKPEERRQQQRQGRQEPPQPQGRNGGHQDQQRQERQQPGSENQHQQKPEEGRQQQPQRRNGGHQDQQRQERPGGPSWRRGGGQRQQRGEGDHHQAAWQGRRANDWKSEHRDWRERGGYRGYRIPEARYRGSFGPDHAFRIQGYPLVVIDGYPRFQYGGFWISVVDPWPEYWSSTWYDDDDVYIEYSDGGYYMQNRRYPQDRISISIQLN